jgi:hypothetical protein
MKKQYNLLIISFLIALSAFAQEPSGVKVSSDTIEFKEKPHWLYSTEQTLTNSYVWKGIEFYSGVVTRPSLVARYGDLKIQSWSHLPLMLNTSNSYNPDINLFISYERRITPELSITPQLSSFFYPSNYKNIFTTLLNAAVKYELEPVGVILNPMIDVCGNLGAVNIEYGFYKEARINHRLSLDSRILMGWGNVAFTEFFVPTPPKSEYIIKPKSNTPQTFRNSRVELMASYEVSDRITFKPQFSLFSNFMRSYTNQRKGVLANGGLTVAYSFSKN